MTPVVVPEVAVLASGTIPANIVTASYGFVDVGFTTTPAITTGTRYWIQLTSVALNNTDYWVWQSDISNPYPDTKGVAKWATNWSGVSWTSVVSNDLAFRTFMGGVITSVVGAPGVVITGDTHANTIQNLTINKNAYYQVLSGATAAGYFPGSPDPAPQPLPISDGQLDAWKTAAQSAGTFTGNISTCRTTWASGKYVGNVTFSNGCSMTAQSPIWITGSFTLGNGNTIRLNNSFGADSGVIVVDGIVNVNNSNVVKGTTSGNSELMIISTYDSPANAGANAININNSGNQVVLYAGKGYINIANGNTLEQITAAKIIVANGVTLNYNAGFSSLFFSSGPSGAFSAVKGSLH
jgi:hypothetical protein